MSRGPGTRASLASFLQLAVDPSTFPFYRPTLFANSYELLGFPGPRSSADEAAHYAHALTFLDRVLEESRDRGLMLRDRLDAQAVLWRVMTWKGDWEPVAGWSPDDRARYLSFRGAPVESQATV